MLNHLYELSPMKSVMTALACRATVSFVAALSSSSLVATLTLNKGIERQVLSSRDCLTV